MGNSACLPNLSSEQLSPTDLKSSRFDSQSMPIYLIADDGGTTHVLSVQWLQRENQSQECQASSSQSLLKPSVYWILDEHKNGCSSRLCSIKMSIYRNHLDSFMKTDGGQCAP